LGIQTADGQPYFHIDYLIDHIMKLSPEEKEENKAYWTKASGAGGGAGPEGGGMEGAEGGGEMGGEGGGEIPAEGGEAAPAQAQAPAAQAPAQGGGEPAGGGEAGGGSEFEF